MNNGLINRNFFLLWIGRLVSQIGDKFYGIALAWWVLQKTKSPVIMGMLMMTSALPGLLIAPLAGTFIDRWYRKRVIIIADLIRGVFVLAVAILSAMQSLVVWHVFVAAAIISLGSIFYDPTIQAIVPQIVSEEQLPKANSYSQIVGGISTVLGPIFGAVSVSLFSYTVVFSFNGLSYIVSAICAGLMAIPRIGGSQSETQMNPKAWDDFKTGMKFLFHQKSILIVISVIGFTHFFFGSLLVSLPFLVDGLVGKGVQNLGYLETMMGLGLIAGSIYISLKTKAALKDKYLFLFVFILGFSNFSIGILKGLGIISLTPYLLVMTLVGAAVANASIYWQSILQVKTPTAMAGRIFSISTMIGNLSMPLAYGLFGFWLKLNSLMNLMIISGISLIILSVILFTGYSKERS
ncbi:MAG TPA: MFS transporter [Bacillota bacterium]|nr:MFS transporter [Bacillota bacterium]